MAKLLSAVLELTLSCLDLEIEKINCVLMSKKLHSKKNLKNHVFRSLNIVNSQPF